MIIIKKRLYKSIYLKELKKIIKKILLKDIKFLSLLYKLKHSRFELKSKNKRRCFFRKLYLDINKKYKRMYLKKDKKLEIHTRMNIHSSLELLITKIE